MYKGKGKYRKSWKERTNVQRKTWIVIFLCVYKKDLVIFSLQDGNYASIELRSHHPLSSSILCKLGTMEALAISNKMLLNVKAIIFPETLSYLTLSEARGYSLHTSNLRYQYMLHANLPYFS